MSVRFFPKIDLAPPGVSPAFPLLTEFTPPSPLDITLNNVAAPETEGALGADDEDEDEDVSGVPKPPD